MHFRKLRRYLLILILIAAPIAIYFWSQVGIPNLSCLWADVRISLAAPNQQCWKECTNWQGNTPDGCSGKSSCYGGKFISCNSAGEDQDGRNCQGCCFACKVVCPPPPDKPPTITGTLNCSSWGFNGWCIGDETLDLVASDPQGATLLISGDLNGTSFACQQGATSCSIPLPEGVGVANYQALSSLGLKDTGTKNWQRDVLPPTIDRQVDQTPNALFWFNAPLNLTAIASDATSGLASVETSLDNAFWSPYATPLYFSDGTDNLYLRAADNAGNVESLLQIIQVDSQNPQLSRTISGTNGANGWYISAVQVAASQTDPAPSSGIQYFETSLDGVNWSPYSTPLSLNDGAYVLQIRVIDNADNQDFSAGAINVDTIPPEADVSFSGTQGSANWYLSPVEVSVATSDATSGVALTEYRVDGGVWQTYTAPRTLQDGLRTIQFKVTDTAGLSTETQVYEFKIDTTEPHIKLPSRWYIWESGEFIVKDDTSRIAIVGYTIADPQGRWKKVERSWTPNLHEFSHTISWNRVFADGVIAPIGNYKVTVYAVDTAGNRYEKEAWIIIPAPDAAPLPTFTPTPIPTDPPVPPASASEAQAVIAMPTSTPFVFSPQPAESKEESGTFTFVSPPAETKPASLPADGILWGTAAAAAIGAFAATAEATRKKREALRAEAARRRKLQKIWDANGAAIYAANQAFKAEHGTEMDAETRNKAIADATVNGVFDAGVYAANLEIAAQHKEPEDDPYAGMEEFYENQDRINAEMLAEIPELEKWAALQRLKDAPIDSATQSYIAMGKAADQLVCSVAEDLIVYESSWWEKPRNWAEAITGLFPTFKTTWNVRNIRFDDNINGNIHIEADAPSGQKLDEFANAASEGWEHGPGGNWTKSNVDNEVAKWVWDDGPTGVFENIKNWFSVTSKEGESEIVEQTTKEVGEDIIEEVAEATLKEVGEEVVEETSQLAMREVGGEILENTVKSGPWDILVSTGFNIYDYGFGEEKDTGILSQEFAVSTGVDITQSIVTGLIAAGLVALAIAFTPLSLSLAVAALVAGFLGAAFDIGLNVSGATKTIKDSINSWIDSLQE